MLRNGATVASDQQLPLSAGWVGLLEHFFLLRPPSLFSDCRHKMKKSKQFIPELDHKQEFFLAGPHTRQLVMYCMEAGAITISLIIQLARKYADNFRFSVFCQFSMGAGWTNLTHMIQLELNLRIVAFQGRWIYKCNCPFIKSLRSSPLRRGQHLPFHTLMQQKTQGRLSPVSFNKICPINDSNQWIRSV